MKTAKLGEVSHGTMRPRDLVGTFAGELKRLNEDNGPHAKLVEECEQWLETDSETDSPLDNGSEEGSDLVEALFDALNEYAPPYAYFGANEGDGASYGWWISEFALEDFDGLRVDDTSEIPADYTGEALHVNDHGNATLYSVTNGQAVEVWGIV